MKYTLSGGAFARSKFTYQEPDVIEFPASENTASFCIRVERSIVPFLYSLFLPVFLTVSIAPVVGLLPPDELADRLGIFLALLLAVVAFNMSIPRPSVSYLVWSERYVSCGIALLPVWDGRHAGRRRCEAGRSHLRSLVLPRVGAPSRRLGGRRLRSQLPHPASLGICRQGPRSIEVGVSHLLDAASQLMRSVARDATAEGLHCLRSLAFWSCGEGHLISRRAIASALLSSAASLRSALASDR